MTKNLNSKVHMSTHVNAEKGFQLDSKISHMKSSAPYEEWESEIQRLVYIGSTLYVLSNSKISSHSLDDYRLIDELSRQN